MACPRPVGTAGRSGPTHAQCVGGRWRRNQPRRSVSGGCGHAWRGHLCPPGQGHPTVSPGLDFPYVPETLTDPGRTRLGLEARAALRVQRARPVLNGRGAISQKERMGERVGQQMPSSGCGEPQNRKRVAGRAGVQAKNKAPETPGVMALTGGAEERWAAPTGSVRGSPGRGLKPAPTPPKPVCRSCLPALPCRAVKRELTLTAQGGAPVPPGRGQREV